MTAVHIAGWVIFGLCVAVIGVAYYYFGKVAQYDADKE